MDILKHKHTHTAGRWDNEGNFYSVRLHTTGYDTYPSNFVCYVEVKDNATGKTTAHRGEGRFIGNFSPIWVKLRGFPAPIQLTELLRMRTAFPAKTHHV